VKPSKHIEAIRPYRDTHLWNFSRLWNNISTLRMLLLRVLVMFYFYQKLYWNIVILM